MQDKILDKINVEYELFFMQCMSCTKELLYSRSKEIEMKKTITSYLRDEVKNNKNIKLVRMSTSNNLLDEFYRYAKDHEDISLREALKNYMKIIQSNLYSLKKSEDFFKGLIKNIFQRHQKPKR